MKVLIAKKAGFCMGVRRAVDLTLDIVNHDDQNISTYGPLIHNPHVLEVLQDKGVGVLTEIPEQADGTVIIRAHGVPPSDKEDLRRSGLKVKDATCPRVLKVQAIINRQRKDGRTTVIVGDRNHAEVEGLMGYAGPDCHVVSNVDEATELELDKPYIIVSQTTQDEDSFNAMTKIITERVPDGLVFNTICDSTHKRQDEVRNLCTQVEALVVVGGKSSANTKRLGEIASGLGCAVFMVESEIELDAEALRKFDQVGITAGASTPTWMINRVVRALEAIPGKGDGPASSFLFNLVRLVMVSNFYVSVAGGLLAYACSFLQGVPPRFEHGLIAFCYLFAMHNINRLTDQRAKIYNDPMSVDFSKKYKIPLLCTAILLLGFSAWLTFSHGWYPFVVLMIMSVFGVLYRIHFIPKFIAVKIRVSRLKEIPGSKTFFVALAWALVVVLLPALSETATLGKAHIGVFIFILLLVFVRNALFDVFEVQGDRIVGKETLPVCIGVDKTIFLLGLIMTGLVSMLVFFPSVGLLASPYGYWAMPGLLYLVVFMILYRLGELGHGVRLEFALETTFVITSFFILIGSTAH